MSEFEPKSGQDETSSADDEIEILEIVGLDEDSPAARPRRGSAEAEEESGQVIELEADFSDEAESDSGESASAAPPEADQLRRLTADFENLRNRIEREREANERHAAARLISAILPILDNFERALSVARETGSDPAVHAGIALIFRQLLDALRREGLSAVDTVGEPFDPEVHEAVATTEAPDLPANTVVEELQRGYLLHERLLRPALVKVNVGGSSSADGAWGSEDS